MTSKNYDELLKQIEVIEEENGLKDYYAFVYWFIETSFGFEKQKILNSICDGMHDKGLDAVLIDDIEKRVIIIQSKFERIGGQIQIKESDIKQFSTVKEYFKSRKALAGAISKANPVAARLLNDAFEAVRNKHYTLELIFITTHKDAPQIKELIHETLGFKIGELSVYHYSRIMQLLADKMRDFTPPLSAYCLPYKDADKTIIRTASQHKSWVLTVPLDEIRTMVNKYRDVLFRKNVRNFLGSNRCNRAIRETLRMEPENFWYYNNGITMLCDEANLVVENKYIRLVNPQIVNGCQTARSIEKFQGELQGEVIVRVIESKSHEFINKITLYQNSFNPIKNRDFKSNDPVQIRLKRELKRHGYYYEIKRGEDFNTMVKKYPAMKQEYFRGNISNEGVAKALAAVKLNPATAAAKGSEAFFDELYDKLFTPTISTFSCLTPFLMHEFFIRETYRGVDRKFHSFKKPWIFKNRAAFHVLALIYEALRNEKDWERKFVAFFEKSDEKEYNKVWSQMAKIISKLFEIIYKSWRVASRKGELDHNTYLQNQKTIGEIKRRHAREIKSLANQTRRVFRGSVLTFAT